jgi:hypothetical protein
LTVICARPKLGKSTFLCNIGANVAYKLLKPVLYVDTEMDFDQWRSRMLSMMSGVDERRIKHGGYTDQEYFNIQQASDLIKKGNLFHEYMPGYSVDKLAAVYNKYKHVEGIELAVFDYIKEPPGGSKDKNRKEYQLLGDVTTALKDMSGELQIPFKHREIEEMDRGGIRSGGHKLVITNSRRGGTTPEEGIGYEFLKRKLQLNEAEVQLIDYDSKEYKEKEEIEHDTDSPESSKSVERF